MKTAYIAGPMRGYPRHNWPAFFEAEATLREMGFTPINPARIDQNFGFNPDEDVLDGDTLTAVIRRDIAGVLTAHCVVVLSGWENSDGAAAEVAVARWMGKPVYMYPSMVEVDKEGVLDIAKRLTSGPRQKNYGHPRDNFQRTADLWTTYIAHRREPNSELTPEDVAWMMVLLKIGRDLHAPTKENLVDSAGYVRTLSMIRNNE